MLQNREEIFAYMNYIGNLNFCEVKSEEFTIIVNGLYNLSVEVKYDNDLHAIVKNLLETTINKIKEEAEKRMAAIAEIAVMM